MLKLNKFYGPIADASIHSPDNFVRNSLQDNNRPILLILASDSGFPPGISELKTLAVRVRGAPRRRAVI